MSQTEIEQLRDRITHLEAMIAEMTAPHDGQRSAARADAGADGDGDGGGDMATGTDTESDGSTRRGLLRAAAAAGAAVVATVVTAGEASAHDADDLGLGLWNTVSAHTETDYTGSTPGAAFLFQIGTDLVPAAPVFTGHGAALTGSTSYAHHPAGVFGYSQVSTGTGVWGVADAGDAVGIRGHGATGVQGLATTASGTGVIGSSSAGYGVRGTSTDSIGVVGNSTNATGVFGGGTTGVRGDGATEGVHGEGLSSGDGVVGNAAGSGNGVVGTSATGFGVSGTTSGNSAGVAGYAATGYGVSGTGYYGVVGTSTTGYGVLGTGTGGVVGSGSQYALVATTAGSAALYLRSAGYGGGDRVAPPTRSDAHVVGELDIDVDGDLWLCVADGVPGTWRKVSGASTAGAFHAITPCRVYDSRLSEPGPPLPIVAGGQRTVSVRDRRSTVDGSVTLPDVVPVGAIAISANVTVVDTVGAGFLAANPGGIHEVGAATINWSASAQILNNGVILTLDANRELNVIAGGGTGAATHFVIDVTGYYR